MDIVRPNTDDFSVFVGDLAPDVTDVVLQQSFQQFYPSVRSAKVIVDPATGRSKGYGFVRFSSEAERDRSLEMQGFCLGARPIRVSLATARRSPSAGMPGTHPAELDPTNTTLFIGGLSAGVSEEQLRAIFGRFGDVVYTKIPQGKGCGFVQYVARPDAEAAMAEMNGAMVGASAIRISWGRSTSRAAALHARPLGGFGAGGAAAGPGLDAGGAGGYACLAAPGGVLAPGGGAGGGGAVYITADPGAVVAASGGFDAACGGAGGGAYGYQAYQLPGLQAPPGPAGGQLLSYGGQLLGFSQTPQGQFVFDPASALTPMDMAKLSLYMGLQRQPGAGGGGGFMRPLGIEQSGRRRAACVRRLLAARTRGAPPAGCALTTCARRLGAGWLAAHRPAAAPADASPERRRRREMAAAAQGAPCATVPPSSLDGDAVLDLMVQGLLPLPRRSLLTSRGVCQHWRRAVGALQTHLALPSDAWAGGGSSAAAGRRGKRLATLDADDAAADGEDEGAEAAAVDSEDGDFVPVVVPGMARAAQRWLKQQQRKQAAAAREAQQQAPKRRRAAKPDAGAAAAGAPAAGPGGDGPPEQLEREAEQQQGAAAGVGAPAAVADGSDPPRDGADEQQQGAESGWQLQDAEQLHGAEQQSPEQQAPEQPTQRQRRHALASLPGSFPCVQEVTLLCRGSGAGIGGGSASTHAERALAESVALLAQLPRLQALTFSGWLRALTWRPVAAALQAQQASLGTRLQALRLVGVELPHPSELESLALAPGLRELTIRAGINSQSLQPSHLLALAAGTQLTALALSVYQCGGSRQPLDALLELTGLRALDVSYQGIFKDQRPALSCDGLSRLARLTRLSTHQLASPALPRAPLPELHSLAATGLMRRVAEAALQALGPACGASLRELRLLGCRDAAANARGAVAADQLPHLAALGRVTQLALSLSKGGLSAGRSSEQLKALSQLRLKALELSADHRLTIGPDLLAALAAQWPGLESLRLSGFSAPHGLAGLGALPGGLAALSLRPGTGQAKLLHGLAPALEPLSLRRLHLDFRAALRAEHAEAVGSARQLEHVSVNTRGSAVGARLLVELSLLPRLTSLQLLGAAPALLGGPAAAALACMTRLRRLSVMASDDTLTQAPPELRAALVDALPLPELRELALWLGSGAEARQAEAALAAAIGGAGMHGCVVRALPEPERALL
ncbi:RBP47C' [Scenedesmus sp. PABB004]|nr:RBP47C' [Scenedesmus sp. PABB004]